MPAIESPQIVPQTVSRTLSEGEKRVWDYLQQNPDAINLSVRKLGEATDTSKTTAADILKRYKQSKQD